MKKKNFITIFVCWFCTPILIGVAISMLSGCTTKKRLKATSETKVETTIQSKKDSSLITIKDVTVSTTDTTKKRTKNADIIQVRTTTKEFDTETNNIKKETITEYTKTSTYISDEDKYFFEHGEFKDSTESKNYHDVMIEDQKESTKSVDEKVERKNKIAKCIGLTLLLLIFCFVGGSIVYKKIKSKF